MEKSKTSKLTKACKKGTLVVLNNYVATALEIKQCYIAALGSGT